MPDKYPEPLFLQCIQFVADNIDIVESFVGFPSQIGQQIFNSCLNKKKFMTGNLTSLELFASEFGAELLNSLNLSGEYLCLNYYLENLLLFKDLTELDVSNCGLGDDHEILANLANLHRLEVFNLCGNCVSDAGIQRMTTPYRMLKRGPNNLKFIDISGNSGVTVKCLKYLAPFLTLTVRMPGPLPEKTAAFQKWKFKKDTYRSKTIVTKGWASGVINEWIVHVKSKKPAIKPTKKTFYSKPVYPQDFTISSTKSYTADVIIAQNRSKELQEKQAYSVVTEQLQKSVCNENNLEDEQKLLSLYSTTQDTSRESETSSTTDGKHNCTTKISVLDKLGNRNSCLMNKQTHLDPSRTRIKSIKSLCKRDASTKVDNGKVSNDIKSIKHYFSTQLHKPDVNGDLTGEISAIGNTANMSRTDGKKKLLSLTLNNKENGPNQPRAEGNEKLFTEKKIILMKKRKRIVITKPQMEKSIEDGLHRPVKCQKVHSQKTQNGSFLDCLDSFI